MTEAEAATLTVESLVVRHRRRRTLDELSFTTDRGVLAVLGPNGAGKSTLFRVLVGLDRADSGRVVFDGLDLRARDGNRSVRRQLGYQPQALAVTNGFTVRESVRYAAWLKGVGRRETVAKVDAALAATRLVDIASRPVRRLSGGQQKRAAIAQAIVHEPRLVVLDEPTAALDPAERQGVLEVVRGLGEHATVLLSTHITSDLAAASDVLVVTKGRTLFCGSRSVFRGRADAGADDADVWESAFAAVCGAS